MLSASPRVGALVGCLRGIGFTMAMFVARLAFSDAQLLGAAKLGASGLAGIIALSVVGAEMKLLAVLQDCKTNCGSGRALRAEGGEESFRGRSAPARIGTNHFARFGSAGDCPIAPRTSLDSVRSRQDMAAANFRRELAS
jgi:hypothetical protein